MALGRIYNNDGESLNQAQLPAIPPPPHQIVGTLISTAVAGVGGYALGKQHGLNEGFEQGYWQAKDEDTYSLDEKDRLIEGLRQGRANDQRRIAQLLQDKGRWEAEKAMLIELLGQKPTTPEAEAILKAIRGLGNQIAGALPSVFENGGDPDIRIN
jgi:hypothetical protein